ncbi:hypothetical protein QUA08_32770, partial [Microcoleus sp. T3B2]|uniref:hypothetical protein n=1 Tax=Microcoleus sp. T3B2 TaxID=3055426 RepID=UPI002FCF1E89
YCTIRERGRSHYNKKNAFYKTEMLPFHKKIHSLWNRPKSLFLRMVQDVSYIGDVASGIDIEYKHRQQGY